MMLFNVDLYTEMVKNWPTDIPDTLRPLFEEAVRENIYYCHLYRSKEPPTSLEVRFLREVENGKLLWKIEMDITGKIDAISIYES